jgi:hypothetical protein
MVGMIMGAGSLLGALALIFIKLGTSRPERAKDKKPGLDTSMARA